MKYRAKLTSLFLSAVILFASAAFNVNAASFADIPASDTALTQATSLLFSLGVAKGTSETTFSPEKEVTREQMAAFTYRLMKAGESQEGGENTSTFTDLTDPTFYFMISWANANGIIKGRSETTFAPKGGITLQDAYTILVRALGYEEKENLPYPYGYIDLAEQLGFNKNLPKTVSYTDTLTRGNVAILLYNTLFANMANKSDDITLPDGRIYPNPLEKVFGAVISTQRVVATPAYSLDGKLANEGEITLNGSLGSRAFESLKLSGKADDYFLSDIKLYIRNTVKQDGTTETKILHAQPLLIKKTADNADVNKVTPTKETDYYDTQTKLYPKASGLLTINGQKVYLFDAPYSYANSGEQSDDANQTYEAQNSKNANFIGLAPTLADGKQRFVTSDYAAANNIDVFGLPDKTLKGTYTKGGSTVNVITYTPDIFTSDLNQMYNDGLYTLDTYDSNSDGLIDYIWYKPYTFGQLINDEDYKTESRHTGANAYSALLVDKVPTIFASGATITGTSYKNQNFVLAYVNGPANYIEVGEVVEKTTAEVKSIDSTNNTITLKNNTKMNSLGTNRLLYHFTGDGNDADVESGNLGEAFSEKLSFDSFYVSSNVGLEKEFYIHDGKLLFTDEAIPGCGIGANDLFIIPQSSKTTWGTYKENNQLVRIPALSAYVSGSGSKSVLIPVSVTNNTPATPYVSNGDYYDFSAYENILCEYTVDSDDIYTLVPLINNDNTSIEAANLMKTSDYEATYGIHAQSVVFKQVTGTTYRFIDPVTKADAANLPNNAQYVSIKDNTQIIIKSKNESGKAVFTEYNASNLPDITNTLLNVQMLLANNPNSTQTEYLAALYAEVDGILENKSETDVDLFNSGIIKSSGSIDIDSEGNYHYYYDIYNPFTGVIATNVPGNSSFKKASNLADPAIVGKFYSIVNGYVQDRSDPLFEGESLYSSDGNLVRTIASPTPENLVQIQTYSPTDRILEIKGSDTIYKVTDDTTVILLEAGSTQKNDFRWATTTKKQASDLGSDSISLRNYYVAENSAGNLTTSYAHNIEAFVAVDTSKSVAGKYDAVKFIIIMREKVTDKAFLN